MANRRVSDEIAHIFLHIDAEKDSRGDSPDVAARHAKLKMVLDKFTTDSRIISRKDLILALTAATSDRTVKDTFELLDLDDDGQRIRLLLQEWVGTGSLHG